MKHFTAFLYFECEVFGFCLRKNILSILNPTLNMQTKDIKCLPIIYLSEYTLLVNRMVQENITISKTDWDSFETSWDFKRHPLI